MIDLKQVDKLFSRQPGSSLLGLAFDGSHLEGIHVRPTNGSVAVKNAFTATLALDPLTAETELAARELRHQLDAQQIRERWCIVSLPLSWWLLGVDGLVRDGGPLVVAALLALYALRRAARASAGPGTGTPTPAARRTLARS